MCKNKQRMFKVDFFLNRDNQPLLALNLLYSG